MHTILVSMPLNLLLAHFVALLDIRRRQRWCRRRWWQLVHNWQPYGSVHFVHCSIKNLHFVAIQKIGNCCLQRDGVPLYTKYSFQPTILLFFIFGAETPGSLLWRLYRMNLHWELKLRSFSKIDCTVIWTQSSCSPILCWLVVYICTWRLCSDQRVCFIQSRWPNR